ncbi:MAG: hypothetical protein R3202_07390, partial [Candidatus Competibacterales bacterium]|nr:hypothetical protein [Candidatus Competibacterales bacterium]
MYPDPSRFVEIPAARAGQTTAAAPRQPLDLHLRLPSGGRALLSPLLREIELQAAHFAGRPLRRLHCSGLATLDPGQQQRLLQALRDGFRRPDTGCGEQAVELALPAADPGAIVRLRALGFDRLVLRRTGPGSDGAIAVAAVGAAR